MSASEHRCRPRDPAPPPGDDEVPVPPPVTEEPPFDRFCDLVMTGGVASGVVYPWAIIELARAYRFRNIGGTSVGAMAAALAAAAEYGRRTGYEAPFEALRRAPASLAWPYPDGRTRMLSLFQATHPGGRRLMWLWGKIGCGDLLALRRRQGNTGQAPDKAGLPDRTPSPGLMWRAARLVLWAYRWHLLVWTLVGAPVAAAVSFACVSIACVGFALRNGDFSGCCEPVRLLELSSAAMLFWGLVGAILAAPAGLMRQMWLDVRDGVIRNNYGLCRGGTVEDSATPDNPPGLSQWLHDGIQASAGLTENDPPLTFRDLWTAPLYPGAGPTQCGPDDPPTRRAINLQVLTTNITHCRPYRLPLVDTTTRLYFREEDLAGYFPPCVLAALVQAARPYEPRDPDGGDPAAEEVTAKGMLELPGADLPLVVAARLSLSYPFLFSAVPLWAIDDQAPKGARTFRKCIFTDGGVSSDFPIELFDVAVPRWPTFGLWLDSRGPYFRRDFGDVEDPDHPCAEPKSKEQDFTHEENVWLPRCNGEGRGESWNRFDWDSKAVDPEPKPEHWTSTLIKCADSLGDPPGRQRWSVMGFLGAIASSATDWHNRTSFRMAHMRNRVVRFWLLPGEGGIHIGMPRAQILDMADRYGTAAGKRLVERYKERDGKPSRAWNEQRWIRFNLLVNALRAHLDGLSTSAASNSDSVPLAQAVHRATQQPGPVADCETGPDRWHRIEPSQADALENVLSHLEELERTLQLATPAAFASAPEPELRLTPPL